MVATKNNIGVLVINYHGVVTEIREKELSLDNDKKTKYRLGTTKITYPDGGSDDVLTRFYVKSIEAHSDVFKVGEKIGLEIQAEGEYAGRAVAKLGGNTVDVSRLLGKTAVPKTVVKTEEELGVDA